MHGYMNAHEFVSLWDEGEGDTFKADPPNAVLTWVDGDEMKEAELLIISAETVSHGRGIAYQVKLEAGDTPADELFGGSLFVDDAQSVARSPYAWAVKNFAHCHEKRPNNKTPYQLCR
jgi:hypothetical protein